MTKRKGWAPPRKRPKRLAKKLERRLWWGLPGYREKHIRFSPEATEEFVRQLLNPPEPTQALVDAIRLAREMFES